MRILVVDDHALVRQGVCALLQREAPEAEVLEAGDCETGLELAARHPDLDVLFLDLNMPGLNGIAALEAFGRARPGLPVIVLTAAEDPDTARAAFGAGALGYVAKTSSAEVLLTALRLVLKGEIYVPALVVRELRTGAAGGPELGPALTPRQTQVLRHLDEGLSNKAIAARLGLTEKTVKGHVTGLLRALSAVDRAQAVRAARAGRLLARD